MCFRLCGGFYFGLLCFFAAFFVWFRALLFVVVYFGWCLWSRLSDVILAVAVFVCFCLRFVVVNLLVSGLFPSVCFVLFLILSLLVFLVVVLLLSLVHFFCSAFGCVFSHGMSQGW